MGLDIFGFRVKHSTLKKHNLTSADNALDIFKARKQEEGEDCNIYFRGAWYVFTYFALNHKADSNHKNVYVVDKSAIKEFKDLCADIIKHKGDEDYCNEKLPISTGYCNIYDNYYWDSVADCRKALSSLYYSMGNKDIVIWDFSL